MHQIHNRFAIFNQGQHIYRHKLSEFEYINPSLPNVTNVEAAINWILAVIYPQTQPAVATYAELPLVGNTLNDYRVVLDDGDGKAASYRWEQREGEGSPSWHKIYDMDWGSDSILTAFYNETQHLYVHKYGFQDRDGSGNIITGLLAGQTFWGGTATGQNLTFNANSADNTGYIQTTNTFRPTADNSLDVGHLTYRFRSGIFGTSVLVDTLSLTTGLIEDSTGAISFSTNDLSTAGSITGADLIATASLNVDTTLTIVSGSITDSSGLIDFDDENLTTGGTVTGAAGSLFGDITLGTGSITSATTTISFGSNNILTTGTGGFGNTTVTRLDVDNLRLDGHTISNTSTNGNIIVAANGTGIVDVQSAMTTLGQTITGVVSITGSLLVDNLSLDGHTISNTNANGDVRISPSGTGLIVAQKDIVPHADNSHNLGSTTLTFANLYLKGAIGDGTTSITSATIQSLRDINSGVATGDSLFWDGAKWVASNPDTEILHNELGNLTSGDAGHTQFALLAGRNFGQTLRGGINASENLFLESTNDGTKGSVVTKDNFRPNTNASYSGSWSGIDLGSSSYYFKDLYTKGELIGARIQNTTVAGLPAASSQNVGRLLYATDDRRVYLDTGSTVKAVTINKYLSDLSFNGSDTTKDVTVSSTIADARNAIWALHDNANDFDRIMCSIKAISATQVRITTTGALPAGSYRLIGLE